MQRLQCGGPCCPVFSFVHAAIAFPLAFGAGFLLMSSARIIGHSRSNFQIHEGFLFVMEASTCNCVVSKKADISDRRVSCLWSGLTASMVVVATQQACASNSTPTLQNGRYVHCVYSTFNHHFSLAATAATSSVQKANVKTPVNKNENGLLFSQKSCRKRWAKNGKTALGAIS